MHKRIALAAVAAVTPMMLAPAGATASAAGQGPQIIAGTLVNGHGAPVRADITVSVEHSTPEGDVETPIAHGFTTPSGQFIIRGGLGKGPATLNPDGSVPLQVDAVANGQDRMFFIAAKPPDPAHGRPDWTWGDVADGQMLPPQANANALAHQPLRGLRLDSGATLDTSSTSNARMATASSGGCYGGIRAFYVWKNNNAWRKAMVPIVHFQMLNHTKMTYTWTTTNKTQLGVAVKVSGDGYGGGLSYSHTQSTSTGIGPVVHSLNGWNGTEKAQWRYRQQRQVCRVIDNVGYPHDTPTGTYRWKPWNFTGGNGHPMDSLHMQCAPNHKVTIQDPLWTSAGHTKTYRRWFSIVGVGLNAAQTTSGRHKLTASVKPGYVKAGLCGSTGTPAVSGLFWEVRP